MAVKTAGAKTALIWFTMIALTSCGRSTDQAAAPSATKPAAHLLSGAEIKLLAELPPAYQHADVDNGRAHFSLCRSCHTVVRGGPDMVGPNLSGVFDRRVATKPGFDYSEALKSKTWAWNASHLDEWLKDPTTLVPGTKMVFYGVHDAKDRVDLVAYLRLASTEGPI